MLVNCELAIPIPMPNATRPGSTCQNVVPGWTAQMTAINATDSSASPPLTIRPTGKRRVRRPASWAPTMNMIPKGSNHRPLRWADRWRAS